MNEYHCPECGGQLVWDYERGEVTCSRCGLVVDRIYYYGPGRVNEDENIKREQLIKRRGPGRRPSTRRYRLYLRRYRLAQRYVRDKPWLEIDYEQVVETGRMVNSIKSRATIIAEKNIEENELWDPINEVIEILREKYPIALARTNRSKYALAYIIYMVTRKHRFPREEEIIDIFQISETSYKRLLKLAKRIIPHLTPTIRSRN